MISQQVLSTPLALQGNGVATLFIHLCGAERYLRPQALVKGLQPHARQRPIEGIVHGAAYA